ncbi:MAG: dTDP-4-dehydrorhamnose 3,5-epimerase [Myxococcota bacterium]
MKFLATEIDGLTVVEPDVHRDPRGFFLETYHQARYQEAGLEAVFVQDNHSRSGHGTLRGLHIQVGAKAQTKLVRAVRGCIWDVAVDVRTDSPTFGHWVGVELSAENQTQFYIPAGMLHGFVVLSEEAEVEYKCSDFYHPESEVSVLWNDPAIGVAWPIEDPTLSERDQNALLLSEAKSRLQA